MPVLLCAVKRTDIILSKDFPHEQSRSRAYRWGEDGIAGVSDTHSFQCIAFAFWNGKE